MPFLDSQTVPVISLDKENGHSTILDPDEVFITSHLQKDLWKLRIEKMVKAVKESLTSQWAAPVILAILLGFVVYDRASTNAAISKQLSEQNERLIRLDQQLQDKSKIEEKEQARRDQIDRENAMWRETMNIKIATLTQRSN